MSSFSEAVPRSIVMRGVEARTLRPARIAADLRSNPFVGIHGADPRLCDPSLEAVVAEAVVVAEEEARAAGWDAGHRAGVEAGRQEARERLAVQLEEIAERDRLERAERAGQWAAALATLQQAAEALQRREGPAFAEVQQTSAVMAVQIAEALVGHHLQVGDCAARDAVERALALAPREAAAVIRLHPEDAATLPDPSDLHPGGSVTLVADESVERGGCIVEAGERRIDAQLGPALDRVRSVLRP